MKLVITARLVQLYHHHVLLELTIHILDKTKLLTVLLVLVALIVTWLVQLLSDLSARLDIIVLQAHLSKPKRNVHKAPIVHLVQLPLSHAQQVLTNLMKFNSNVYLVQMAGTVKELD